jgi:hypothetical protein
MEIKDMLYRGESIAIRNIKEEIIDREKLFRSDR